MQEVLYRTERIDKPDIMAVIGQRVALRRAGREFLGLCPFHDDRHPSFSVNPDKAIFHCFGCGEGGDAIDFIRKLDGLSFVETLRSLGVESSRRPAPRISPNRKAAETLAGWLNKQHLLIGTLCRELSQQITIAKQIPGSELAKSLTQEWEILAALHEDLANPEFAGELWEARDHIEYLTADVDLDPLPEFPALTESYRQSAGRSSDDNR